MIRRCLGAAAIVVVAAISVFVVASGADAPPPTDGFPFLEPGGDYVIRFRDGSNPFTYTSSGVTTTTFTTADGEETSGGPAKWSMKVSLEVFRVIRFSRGSWVLLEHPSNPDDFTKWSAERRAPQQALKEVAAAEIATSQTWINLDHAVAISAVRPDEFDEPVVPRNGDGREKQ